MATIHLLGHDDDHWLCGRPKRWDDLCFYGLAMPHDPKEGDPCRGCEREADMFLDKKWREEKAKHIQDIYAEGHRVTDTMRDLLKAKQIDDATPRLTEQDVAAAFAKLEEQRKSAPWSMESTRREPRRGWRWLIHLPAPVRYWLYQHCRCLFVWVRTTVTLDADGNSVFCKEYNVDPPRPLFEGCKGLDN